MPADTVLVRRGWVLRGRRAAIGRPFPVEVFSTGPASVIDTVLAVQVLGPGG